MRLWLAKKLLPNNYKVVKLKTPLPEDDVVMTGPAQPLPLYHACDEVPPCSHMSNSGFIRITQKLD